MPTTTATSHPIPGVHHARRWLILGVLAVAQLMVVLDATIVNIALPSAQESLGFSDDSRQWVITAYALAFGSLLLLGGRLGDLLGRKRTFIAGLLGFAVASAVAGAAGSFGVLVGARAAQGAFGALLAPSALALLSTTFTDPAERGKAFGIYGAIAGAGGAIGLLLGGVLTEAASWRWCLYVNLLLAVPAALAAMRLLVTERSPGHARLDLPGTVTAVGGLFALVYGFSHAESAGWTDPVTLGVLAAGAVLLATFTWVERRAAHPLLPLRVVLDRNRGGSFLAVALAGAGMFGVFLFLTYYLQQTLGFSPIQTGLAFLPMIVGVVAASTLSTTRLLPRTGPKPLVTAGMLLAATGMLLLTGVAVDSSYATTVLPALVVAGLGFGLVLSPSMSTGTLGVDTADAGAASAMINTSQQVGGSLGTALLSTLASSAVASSMAGQRPSSEALAQAAVHGYTTAFFWSAAIFAVGAVVCGSLLRPGVQAQARLAPDAVPALAH